MRIRPEKVVKLHNKTVWKGDMMIWFFVSQHARTAKKKRRQTLYTLGRNQPLVKDGAG